MPLLKENIVCNSVINALYVDVLSHSTSVKKGIITELHKKSVIIFHPISFMVGFSELIQTTFKLKVKIPPTNCYNIRTFQQLDESIKNIICT